MKKNVLILLYLSYAFEVFGQFVITKEDSLAYEQLPKYVVESGGKGTPANSYRAVFLKKNKQKSTIEIG